MVNSRVTISSVNNGVKNSSTHMREEIYEKQYKVFTGIFYQSDYFIFRSCFQRKWLTRDEVHKIKDKNINIQGKKKTNILCTVQQCIRIKCKLFSRSREVTLK